MHMAQNFWVEDKSCSAVCAIGSGSIIFIDFSLKFLSSNDTNLISTNKPQTPTSTGLKEFEILEQKSFCAL